jgi:Ulp1 family protease
MFFDSANGSYPKYIRKFVKTVQQQGLEENIEFEFLRNKKSHQRGASECGIYCIHFIIEMLMRPEKALNVFMNGSIPDKKINKFRNVYFNKPEK